jgi:sugar O-acyltransferase (sialic acid O-acetyltransferase NeuD family)
MTDSIVLIGGGGHCKACIDVIESTQHTIAGILDKEPGENKVLNYSILGGDDEIKKLIAKGHEFLITIGQIKSAASRVHLYEKIIGLNGKLSIVFAASALISKYATVGKGTIVMHQAIINVSATVGNNCIINTKALIEHDCFIDDHSHISTGAIVNGHCRVGKRVFIGSNSVLVQGVQIGDEVVIGAGSVVVNNITDSGIYAGNPIHKIA